MGRGSKVVFKQTTRRRVHPNENGADESDEEYKLEEDEELDESDEYFSLDGDESEELLADFEENEEEDEKEKNVKRIVRSKPAQKCSWKRKRKRTRVKKPQKKRRVSPKVEDDEVEEDDDDYEVEDEDEDEDEEEFILDESDCVDEEVEMPVMKKNRKVSRPHLEKSGPSKRKKRSRKSKVLKKPARHISKKKQRLTRKTNSDTTNKSIVVQETSRNTSSQRKRRKEESDSDFVSSVSSDFEYTITEEEREQVREATRFCTNFNISLRSSLSMKRSQEEETVFPQRRRTGRKGKEKAVDMKNEVVKQVCGICLSEEGKKTVRGSLDCCSHYFCFACITEWSKVESRCPLCKQRFMTISKPARSNTGFELRTVVIQVPQRDQVYQPSEEELQGYLDPYVDVICIECHQGGEDAFMLLCDICDSPAHTFCVGLGHDVPEGNWYCEGCQPAAFASLNPQGPPPTPDQRAYNVSVLASPFPVGIDLNEMYVPETPMTQENRNFPSIRRRMGDSQVASPISGTGAFTLSDRRRIQHQINNFLNNRTSQAHVRSNGISAPPSGIRLFGLQLEQARALTPQQTISAETAAPLYSNNEGRLEGNTFTLARSRDLISVGLGHFSGQIQNQTSTSATGLLQAEHGGFGMSFNPSLVHEQLHPCTSRSNVGADASLFPYAYGEVSHFNVEKGQVQQMVKSHLKSLSSNIELGYSAFKDIARKSTHTILAAYGLEHKASEVRSVQASFVCNHLGGAGREMSLMKDNCSSCFNLFVKDVVTHIIKCAT